MLWIITRAGRPDDHEKIVNGAVKTGLKLTGEDDGIRISKEMKDGYTTRAAWGWARGGSKRLVNKFLPIKSEVGKGTKITVVRWK